MPAFPLARISKSVSRNGDCKTNLRGVSPASPYDYAAPTRAFIVGPALESVSTEGQGDWSNTIKAAYSSRNSELSATITYPSLVSTAISGTLLIRLFLIDFTSGNVPPEYQTVFKNGNNNTNGYGLILYSYLNKDTESYNYTLFFGRLQDTSGSWVNINPDANSLNTKTWYQYSIKFTSAAGNTTVLLYQGGTFIKQATITGEITTPTGGTEIMNFYGAITDFALIESSFSDSQLAAYGTAPYI